MEVIVKEFRAPWKRRQEFININDLTEMETAVLIASRTNDYNDCIDNYTWVFAVKEDSVGVSKKQFRGVFASLIKKGYAYADGNGEDAVFGLTEKGKSLFTVKKIREDIK